MGNRIGPEALQELAAAYEDGRVSDKHLVRLARNPHLVSDLVVSECELWQFDVDQISDLVYTPDLHRAAWLSRGVVRTTDGKEWTNKGMVYGLQISPSGNRILWLENEDPAGSSRIMIDGAVFVCSRPSAPAGPVKSVRRFIDAALLGDDDVACITTDLLVLWRGRELGLHSPYPFSIGVVAGQVIWTAGFALWHEGTKIADRIVDCAINFKRDVLDRCVVSPDGKHFLYQARDGKTPLFLDGKEWQRDFASLYGFLTDGSMYCVVTNSGGATSLLVLHWTTSCEQGTLKLVAGHSVQNIVVVRMYPDESKLCVGRNDQTSRQHMRRHDEVPEIIICGTEDFAYIARDGKQWAIYRVHGSESERIGPTYRHQPSKLIASPDGKHLAWIVTEPRSTKNREYAVLSGDAGRFHERVIHHAFANGEYRYLARDGQIHRALAVTLAG